MTFFISFSAQATASLVEVPVALEGGELRIGLEDRVILHLRVERQEEGAARHDVLVVDFLLGEQVADPFLRGLNVLREFPDRDRARRGDVVPATRTRQAQMVIDAVG
jgi:hypothetical protein